MSRWHAPRKTLKLLRVSERGIAAIEFAFIAPLFVFILTTVISLYAQGTAQREVQQATASVSDLAARYVYIDDERIEALGASAEALLQSTPSVSNIRLALASFHNPEGEDSYDYTALWAKTYGGATPITSDEIHGALAENVVPGSHLLGNSDDTMLFLRIEVDFVSPFGVPGMNNEATLVRNAWVMPRYANSIEFRDSDDESS